MGSCCSGASIPVEKKQPGVAEKNKLISQHSKEAQANAANAAIRRMSNMSSKNKQTKGSIARKIRMVELAQGSDKKEN